MWLFQAMTSIPSDAVQFSTPGSTSFELADPGPYVLSHDARAVFQGQVYDNSSDLPDRLRISLVNTDTGNEIYMRRGIGTRRLSERHVRHTVGKFDVETPGNYELSVTGDNKVRIFAMGPSYMGKLTMAAVACAGLNLVGWIGALVITMTVLVKRIHMKRLLPDE